MPKESRLKLHEITSSTFHNVATAVMTFDNHPQCLLHALREYEHVLQYFLFPPAIFRLLPFKHILRYSLRYSTQLMTETYYRYPVIYLLTTIISKSISSATMNCQLLPVIYER